MPRAEPRPGRAASAPPPARWRRSDTRTRRIGYGTARLALAALGVTGLVGRYVQGFDYLTFTTGNYLAYLTIQSNIAAVVVFVITAVRTLRGRPPTPALTVARLIVTALLVVAGTVFALMVTQAPALDYPLDVLWSDQVLHFVLPVLALLDWVLGPLRTRVGFRWAAVIVGYPLVWGGITMLRGAAVGWYPYFFLDPLQVRDPLEFCAYAASALAVFAGLTVVLVVLSRLVPPPTPVPETSSGGADAGADAARAPAVRTPDRTG